MGDWARKSFETISGEPEEKKNWAQLAMGHIPAIEPTEEAPVGGTFITKPFTKGGLSGTSTITGKPIKEFYPGKEPEAGFLAMAKSGLVDDPFIRAKIFSQSRGIPITRYRVSKTGQIEFKDDEGNWQREVSEAKESKVLNVLAQESIDPRAWGGTVGGMVAGGKGVVGGMTLGSIVRKGIAKGVFGEKIDWLEDLTDVGMDAAFSIVPVTGAKLLEYSINRFLLGRGAGVLRQAGKILEPAKKGVEASLLTLEEQAKAAWLTKLADQQGIKLLPHQAYDKQGLENLWKYLRQSPTTADAIQSLETELASANDAALTRFIKSMGGYEKGPYTVGRELQEVSEGAIEDLVKRRSQVAGKIYKKAFEEAPEIDVKPVIDFIDRELEYSKGPVREHLLNAKKILLKPDLPKEVAPEGGLAEVAERVRGPVRKKQDIVDVINDLTEGKGISLTDPNIDRIGLSQRESGMYGRANIMRKRGEGLDTLREEINHAMGLSPDTTTDELARMVTDAMANRKSGVRGELAEKEVMDFFDRVGRQKGDISYETRLQGLHQAKMAIDDLISTAKTTGVGNTARRNYLQIKELLLKQMGEGSPEYIKASTEFAKLSQPIDKLRDSVIGEIADLGRDPQVAAATRKLLSSQGMPDADLLREAKAIIAKKDPELWERTIGTYIRDTYEGLRESQGGRVINPVGKLHQKLYGSSKQREVMDAAFEGLPQGQAFKDLMVIFERAAIGYGKESMTWNFAQIDNLLSGGKLGLNMAKLVTMPKQVINQWTFQKWNDIFLSGRQQALFDVLSSPGAIEQLGKLRRLPPGSRKLIEGLAALTATTAVKYMEKTP